MSVIISEFEVLFSGLIPPLPLPLVAQGYFLQISNSTGADQTVTLTYNETSGFENSTFNVDGMTIYLLSANYLDGSGYANPYNSEFIDNGYAFSDIVIPDSQTFVFGLQAFPTPTSTLPESHPAKSGNPKLFVAPKEIPMFGIQWHGYVTLSCAGSGSLYIYPTTRGVFFDPVVETTVAQSSDVITLGLTTGQTYSPVPTSNGTAVVSLPA